MTQYRAFIQTAEGLGAVARELAAAEASLDALLADAPALEAAAEGFAKTATALLAGRAQNKQLHSEPLDACYPLQAPACIPPVHKLWHVALDDNIRVAWATFGLGRLTEQGCGLTPCAMPDPCTVPRTYMTAASDCRLPRHGAGAAGGAAADGHLRAQRQLRRGPGPAGARAAVCEPCSRASQICLVDVTMPSCILRPALVRSLRQSPGSATAAFTGRVTVKLTLAGVREQARLRARGPAHRADAG